MFGLKTALHLVFARYFWRTRNANNGTSLGRYLVGTENISIGRGSYGPISILTSDKNPKVVIGSFCSIADGVTFITGDEHPTDRFSTYPFKVILLGDKEGEALTKGGIIVEDDVWIGYGATILDGVHIHRGGVVASGAVVSKDVPPYTVVGGVPAKPIHTRFDSETIERLLSFDYSTMDMQFVKDHLDLLYAPLNSDALKELLSDAEDRNEH